MSAMNPIEDLESHVRDMLYKHANDPVKSLITQDNLRDQAQEFVDLVCKSAGYPIGIYNVAIERNICIDLK